MKKSACVYYVCVTFVQLLAISLVKGLIFDGAENNPPNYGKIDYKNRGCSLKIVQKI